MSAENTGQILLDKQEAGQDSQIPLTNEKLVTSISEIPNVVEKVTEGDKVAENADIDKKEVDSETTVKDNNTNHAKDSENEGGNSENKTAEEKNCVDPKIFNCRVELDPIDSLVQNLQNQGIEEYKVDKVNTEDLDLNNTNNDKPELESEMVSKEPILNENEIAQDTDISSIVTEDLTKGVAQIEIEKGNECVVSENLNKIDIEEPKLPEGLIHKVDKLDLSEKENKIEQNNWSSVDLKKKTDSLKNLLVYNSDEDKITDSEDEDEDSDNDDALNKDEDESESETESETDSETEESEDSSSDSDISSEVVFEEKKGASKKVSEDDILIRAPGELGLGDLPPVADLSKLDIDYEKEEFLHMGHILAVIDTLVTIGSEPGTPAYNLDSCLFYENESTKKPLGLIYDVIGPVANPIYCVRFNSTKDIEELHLKEGMKVYSAPKSAYTSYVFLKELMQHKGSDASWLGDVEMPPEVAAALSDDDDCDYDDTMSTSHKPQKRKHSSLERHKEFEQSMNRCNTINTRVANLVDAQRNLQRSYAPPRKIPTSNYTYRLPVQFDPTVPPPGFQVVPPFPVNSYPSVNPHFPPPLRNGGYPSGQNSPNYVLPRQAGNSWQHSLGPGPSTQQY